MIVTFDDGAQTRVEQWGTAGPAILCVHGMTSSRLAWARFGEHFAQKYRVYAYDQRGHGDSAHVKGPMRLDRADADLLAVRETIAGEVAALVGHSWGGAVALRGGRKTNVQRVIAVDPMMYVPPGFNWHEEYVADFEADLTLEGAMLQQEYTQRYEKAGWSALDIFAKLHAVRSMTAEPLKRLNVENRAESGAWDLRDIVMEYPKPLLMALAEVAESTVAQEEREWLAKFGGPNVRSLVYEGQGHNLHRTAFDRFVSDVEEWLEEVEPVL